MNQQPIVATVRIQSGDFHIAAEISALCAGHSNIGAVATFTGLCRDEDAKLRALELEHYPGMAQAELTRIADQAIARWQLIGLTVIHRHGLIKPGENIVLVIAAAKHRQAAFAAAGSVMDFLKTRAPFWKKEHLSDGSTGAWVEARAEDDEAAERWN